MTALQAPPDRLGRLAVGALGVLALALGTLQTVVDPARPMLERELAVDSSGAALVATTLLIAGAVVAPIAGTLGDRYGGKRVLLMLMALVSVGGVISSSAPNLAVLLVGQMLQGAMVGALPLSFILVRKHLPPGRTQVAIGVVSALFTAGGIVGTLVAGPLAEGLSWHWIFAAPTAVTIAATLVVLRTMPDDAPSRRGTRIDWWGVVLLGATLLTAMLGLTVVVGGGLPPPLAVLAVVLLVVALGAAFVRVERRAPAPMVELRLLAGPALWSAALLTAAVAAVSAMLQTFVPKMFEMPREAHGFGLDTSAIGVLMLPASIAGVVAGAVGGAAVQRFGARAVVAAGAVVAALALLSLALVHDAAWQPAVARAVVAFAGSLITTALLASTAVAVDAADTGTATSLLVVIRLVGAVLGAQLAGSALGAGIDPGTGQPSEQTFTAGFLVAAALSAAFLLIVRHLRKGSREL